MSARGENGQFISTPENASPEREETTQLYHVTMPARGDHEARAYGFYVTNGAVSGTIGGHEWAIWQNWNREVKPWLARRGATGRLVAPGERLEL